jgi:hypothetical protein
MDDYLSALDTPMTVEVVEGEVVVLGPRSVSVSLTPAAAEISGERLIEAARLARLEGWPKPKP